MFKKLLTAMLVVASVAASASITYFEDPKGGFKIQLFDVSKNSFTEGGDIRYLFPGKKKDIAGKVTILSTEKTEKDDGTCIIGGTLAMELGDSILVSDYKAKFNEDDGLEKFRIDYNGAKATFVNVGHELEDHEKVWRQTKVTGD